MLIVFKAVCLAFITLSQATAGDLCDLEKGAHRSHALNRFGANSPASSVDIDETGTRTPTPADCYITFPQTADMPLAALEINNNASALLENSLKTRRQLCCLSCVLLYVPSAIILWLIFRENQ